MLCNGYFREKGSSKAAIKRAWMSINIAALTTMSSIFFVQQLKWGIATTAQAMGSTLAPYTPSSSNVINIIPKTKPPVVVDIISIGSHTQPDLQKAQLETFGSHPAVRNFYAATEDDDEERDCATNLTLAQLSQISTLCRSRLNQGLPVLEKFRSKFAHFQWLQKKGNPTGWMCAQKRPMQAFFHAVQKYYYIHIDDDNKNNNKVSTHSVSWSTALWSWSSSLVVQDSETTSTTNSNTAISSTESSLQLALAPERLPDYLILGDDDMWVNIDQVLSFVPNAYPASEPRAVAGCMIRFRVNEHNFTFPFGGFGFILNRPALFNFLRPLNCSTFSGLSLLLSTASASTHRGQQQVPGFNTNNATFEELACWRIAQNGIGEMPLFRDGMSIADLMHAYSNNAQYLQVETWETKSRQSNGGLGFCLHSDWVWGYFINYYHLALHSTQHGRHRRRPYNHNDSDKVEDHSKNGASYPNNGDQEDDKSYYAHVLHDRLEGYNSSFFYDGRQTPVNRALLRQCLHTLDFQSPKAILLRQQQEQLLLGISNNASRLSSEHDAFIPAEGNNSTSTSTTTTTISTSSPSDLFCPIDAHFCHRVSPAHMRHLNTMQREKDKTQLAKKKSPHGHAVVAGDQAGYYMQS
ncbi:hypothetical protein ACA910_001069 [Epithemia clementina (nom. ined.)]